MKRDTPMFTGGPERTSHMEYVRGVLPDYVDPLPRSFESVVARAKGRNFVVSVMVAVLATWLLWPTPTPEELSDSEARVIEFLTAVRTRDVDAAMAMTDGVPQGADPGFLVPAAISSDWDFQDVEDGYGFSDGRLSVEVSFTLVDAEGYGHPGEFTLERDALDEPWTLLEPFILISFPKTSLAYVEANEARLPEPKEVGDQYDPPQFAMFPGVYRFYSDVDSLLEVKSVHTTLVPNIYTHNHSVEAPAVRVLDETAVQLAVDNYLDHCASLSELAPEGCPFGTDRVPVPDRDGYVFRYVSTIEWEIVDYPVVTVGEDDLEVTDRRRGEIRLKATNVGGDKVAVVDCTIVTDRLAIRVLLNGRLHVYPESMGQDGRYTCDV